jgi:hypothetical protein
MDQPALRQLTNVSHFSGVIGYQRFKRRKAF